MSVKPLPENAVMAVKYVVTRAAIGMIKLTELWRSLDNLTHWKAVAGIELIIIIILLVLL